MVQKELLLWTEGLAGDEPVPDIELDDSIQENEAHEFQANGFPPLDRIR